MRKLYIRILTVFLCLLCSVFSAKSQVANWTSSGPSVFPTNLIGQINGIGRVSQLKFDPINRARVYAVAAHAVFVSNDSTGTWSVLHGTDEFPTSIGMASICIDYTNNNILYLGTGDGNWYNNGMGVWKSTDGGNTFVQANSGMGNAVVIDIIMSPTDHNTLVAATYGGIFKSTNGGATWTETLVGGNFTSMRSNAGIGSFTLYGATNTDGNFYRSTDFGSTWTANNIAPSISYYGGRIGVTPADSSIVYVSYVGKNDSTGGVIYRSSDGGKTFAQQKGNTKPNLDGYTATTAGQGRWNWALTVDPANANTVYTAGNLIWKSTDGGVTWTQMEPNWATVIHTDMHGILFNPWNSAQLFDINDGGVWVNTDGTAKTWTPKCQGLISSEFYHMANSHINGNVIGGGLQDNGEVFLKNGTWYGNRGGDFTSTYYTDRTTNEMYYLASGQRRDVYNSPTGSPQSLGLPSAFTPGSSDVMAFSNVNSNVAFWSPNPLTSSQNANYQTLDGFYVTTNLSNSPPAWSWTQYNGSKAFSMATSYGVDSLFILYSNGSFTRVANASGLGGTRSIVNTPSTFVSSTLGVSSFSSGALAITKSGKIYLAANGSVFKSSNNGSTWTAVGSGPVTNLLKGQKIIKMITDTTHTSRDVVYAITNQSVYYMDNTLTDWMFYDTDLPSTVSITDVDIFYDTTNLSNSLLRVATYGRGVWQTPIATTFSPMVSISSPTNSASFSINSSITLTATASTPNTGGSIAKVDFYNGNTLLGTSTASPYKIVWNNVAKGDYSITAVATDNNGLTTTSAVVNVGVGEASFAAVADAYVRNGSYAGSNFGTDPGLMVKDDGTSYFRESYLRFDFSAYAGTSVDSAKFNIYAGNVNTAPTRVVSVYGVADTTWGENTITYNNQPTDPGTLIGNFTVTNANGVWYQWAVTSYINSQLAAGHRKVSFRLIDNGPVLGTSDVTFNSREAATNNPQLLFFRNPPAPPTISITSPTNNSIIATGSNITINATASSPNTGGSIAKVDFYNGKTLLGTSTSSPYSYTWNNVSVGTDTLTTVATDNNGLATTSSAITVVVSTPPTVSITAPANNTVVPTGSNITISANASSPNTGGSIAKVDFYNGKTLLGTSTTSPYSYTWNNVVGTDTLTTVATDNNGLTTTSSAIAVVVSTPPTVSITTPANNAVVATGSNITISANASSPDTGGSIAKVDFYNGATLLGTFTSAPYSYTWNNVSAATDTLKAVATDNNGLTTTSSAITIVVSAPPTVSITAPVNNTVVASGSNITINANAGSPNTGGSIAKVDFYNGFTLLESSTNAPYSYTWNNVINGTDSLTAVATDNNGLTTTSSAIAVVVSTPPTISITAPVNNAVVETGSNITINANASSPDAGGSIAKVDFYQGSTLLGTSTTSPYSYTWNNLSAGTDTLKAIATDNNGLTTTSSNIAITVSNPPVVSLTAPANNSTVMVGSNVTLNADASSPNAGGSIAKVDFYNGSTLLGTSTTAPYSYAWNNVPAGTDTLKAVATDNNGFATTSAPVIFNVALNVTIPDVYALNPAVDDKNTIYIGYGPTSLSIAPVVQGGQGYSYSWSNGGNTASISVSQAGTYTVNVFSTGGGKGIASITIDTLDVRCGNDSTKVQVCHNQHTICVASSAVQAHLDHGDKLGSCVGTVADAHLNVPANTLTDANTDNTTNIEVYPNPVGDILHIAVPKLEANATIHVYSYSAPGKEVRSIKFTQAKQDISFQGLAPGYYFLVIKNGNHTINRTIIKK